MGKRRFLKISKGVMCSRMEKNGTVYVKISKSAKRLPSTREILMQCGVRSV